MAELDLVEHFRGVVAGADERPRGDAEEAPLPRSQRELADLMHIEPPTLVRHLDRLEADGFVERRPDPDDRRRLLVFVTPAGRRRLTELHKVADRTDTDLRSLLDEHEIEVLGDVLLRIHEHFTVLAGEEASRGRH